MAGVSDSDSVTSSHIFWLTDARRNSPTDTTVCCPYEWPTSSDAT